MGGGGSKPQVEVIEDEAYPGTDDDSRTNSLSITGSQGCKSCALEITPGISSSSVNISRLFGDVRTCDAYGKDLQRVSEKEMSARDFVGAMQRGKYLRPTSPGFCEELRFPDEIAAGITTPEQLQANGDKAITVRIRKISSGGFSMDTKARFTPNIPFKMTFNGQPVLVRSITLYHPSPLRLNYKQGDAVISLNDPSDGYIDETSKAPPVIVLIPIVAGDPKSPSASFFNKLVTHIPEIADPDFMTGLYNSSDFPTGNDWSLTQLFPPKKPTEGCGKIVDPG